MSRNKSTDQLAKQFCSGAIAGGLVGLLSGREKKLLSSAAFVSIGFIDLAYHQNAIKFHLTHLTHNEKPIKRNFVSNLKKFSREIRREMRDPNDDLHQEARWVAADFREYVQDHTFFGLGFALSFLFLYGVTSK